MQWHILHLNDSLIRFFNPIGILEVQSISINLSIAPFTSLISFFISMIHVIIDFFVTGSASFSSSESADAGLFDLPFPPLYWPWFCDANEAMAYIFLLGFFQN